MFGEGSGGGTRAVGSVIKKCAFSDSVPTLRTDEFVGNSPQLLGTPHEIPYTFGSLSPGFSLRTLFYAVLGLASGWQYCDATSRAEEVFGSTRCSGEAITSLVLRTTF